MIKYIALLLSFCFIFSQDLKIGNKGKDTLTIRRGLDLFINGKRYTLINTNYQNQTVTVRRSFGYLDSLWGSYILKDKNISFRSIYSIGELWGNYAIIPMLLGAGIGWIIDDDEKVEFQLGKFWIYGGSIGFFYLFFDPRFSQEIFLGNEEWFIFKGITN